MTKIQDTDGRGRTLNRLFKAVKLGPLIARTTAKQRIITDADTVSLMRERWSTKADRFCTLDAFLEAPTDAGDIFLLLRDARPALKRRLQVQFRAHRVIDIVYDVLPRLLVQSTYGDLDADPRTEATYSTADAGYSLTLASPGSEVEVLLDTVESAGMGGFVELFPPVLAEWLAHMPHFSLPRFVRGVVTSLPADRHSALLLRTTTLDTMIDAYGLPFRKLRQRVAISGVPVVHWIMRDRCRQAVLAAHCRRMGGYSAYNLKISQRSNRPVQPYAFAQLMSVLTDIITAETRTQNRLGGAIRVLTLTYEDFCRQPAAVLEAYSHFIGVPPKGKAKTPDTDMSARFCVDLTERSQKLAWDLIDALGLHASPHGSVLPKSQQRVSRIKSKTKTRAKAGG